MPKVWCMIIESISLSTGNGLQNAVKDFSLKVAVAGVEWVSLSNKERNTAWVSENGP